MFLKKLLILVPVFLLIYGCEQTPVADTKADADTLRTLEEQWSNALKEKDVEKIIGFYSPDYKPINIDSVRKRLESDFADTNQVWDTYSAVIEDVEVSSSGDLAYARGTDNMTMVKPEGPGTVNGRWVDVWKKTNGQWKVVTSIWAEVK